jgi:hypothetical protein
MIKTSINDLTYKISFSHRLPPDPNPKLSKTKGDLVIPGTSCTIRIIDRFDDEIASVTEHCKLSKNDSFCYETGRKYALAKAIRALKDKLLATDYVAKTLWDAYFSRRKPDYRKMVSQLKPTDPNYTGKLRVLTNRIFSQDPSHIDASVSDWAKINGL